MQFMRFRRRVSGEHLSSPVAAVTSPRIQDTNSRDFADHRA